jgi:long-chain acyl-CoA synthetase
VAENFVRLLEAVARRAPDAPAVVWEGGLLTYRRLDRQANGFARFLSHQGVRAGERVALSIPNRWPFAVALLGGLKLGVTVVPLDPLLTAQERQVVLGDLRPRVIAHEVVGDEAEWDSAAAVDHPALILYTSGSTGVPKGAMLSHDALRAAVQAWAEPVMGLGPADVVLAALPLSHSFGLNGALLAPLLTGAVAVLLERFAPDEAVAAIRRRQVTVFPGAAPCSWALAREWRARTGVRILRGYGMTELFRPISYRAADPTDLPEAIGRPVPGVEVCITDDDGRALPAGAVGELWIRSPSVMDGYLGAPEETTAVLAGGWFKTGDLAILRADGYVSIEGRKRERILRGGYSVSPPEVEAVLHAHPAVAEAAVVGVPHTELGEEVVAFVALRPGAREDPQALVAWCRERLAGFKYPRRITIVDHLPRASTGKVLKSRLLGQT